MLTNLQHVWDSFPVFRSMRSELRKGASTVRLPHVPLGFGAFVVAGLQQVTRRPIVCITPDSRSAEHWQRNLRSWLGNDVDLLPELDIVPYRVMARSQEIRAERVRVLYRMSRGQTQVVVAPVGALLRLLPPRTLFDNNVVHLRVGERIERDELLQRLFWLGYERVDTVRLPGQYSVRGGIVDVFSPHVDTPVRCEWFDDELDSLRRFNTETQISAEIVTEQTIVPADEIIWPAGRDEAIEQAIRKELSAVRAVDVAERVEDELSRLPHDFGLREAYASYLYDSYESALHYAAEDCLYVLWRPAHIREQLDFHERQWQRRADDLFFQGQILDGQRKLQLSPDELNWDDSNRQRLLLEDLSELPRRTTTDERIYEVSARQVPSLQGQWQLIEEELSRRLKQEWQIIVALPDDERAERLKELLRNRNLPAAKATSIELGRPGIVLTPGAELDSFESEQLRLLVLTSSQLLGSPMKRRQRRRRRPSEQDGATPKVQSISHWEDLRTGDYVVHVTHGIGRYLGMKTMEVQGTQRDYLVLQYNGEDRLFVPTDQIELVQKYIGVEGKTPRLSRLGGSEWTRVKQRVKQSVRVMAEELLRLYAARAAVEGHAFAPDTVWQKQFEDAFPYEETPDQLRAIEEIKRDMESTRPMDRLLCGDVGFGKTEVALRAAFKAVMDDRQVAILVPTTILAQQHYLRMLERFKGFPVEIAMLSRFSSQREQQEVITGLRRGTVDIVVGTHRLLGGDVDFKQLGLVIIDEEQRFGVRHKERLKQLRNKVDVLTLTATPIPRTLHMGMVGLRDMSLIETPPENRFPVETYVVEYSDALVRDAILKELNRGGQVYYVSNRVRGIEQVSRRLKKLVPDARIGVAHGQMSEDELERVMVEFTEGEFDVLVCTTIIESGLDIANVNTLIVQDSDRFGLSQLYQIRGRVGRSDRLAYAYLTYRPGKILSEAAEKRLRALKEFTELGAGFKIALRDLEIRGAGNILGPEQSGFIVSVGFDLYVQLLEEAIQELRGTEDEETPRAPASVEIPVDAYLPDSYIGDSAQKTLLYKRINALEQIDEVDALYDELEDRFGTLPRPVDNLLQLARLRVLATDLMAISVAVDQGELKIVFPVFLNTVFEDARSLAKHWQRRLVVEFRPGLHLRLRKPGLGSNVDGHEWLRDAWQLLSDLASLPAVETWRNSDAATQKAFH